MNFRKNQGVTGKRVFKFVIVLVYLCVILAKCVKLRCKEQMCSYFKEQMCSYFKEQMCSYFKEQMCSYFKEQMCS